MAYKNLEDIVQAIIDDEENQLFTKRGILPLFMAPPTTKILLIGQAPGQKSQSEGVPFLDKSGERLKEWLGVDHDTFYHSGYFAVLPMDFYFPGKGKSGDLPPRKHIAQKWHAEILKFLPNVQLTILVGSYAQQYYLKQTGFQKLTDNVQHFKYFLPQYFPIPHPSPRNRLWQANHPWFDETVLPTLKDMIKTILEQEN